MPKAQNPMRSFLLLLLLFLLPLMSPFLPLTSAHGSETLTTCLTVEKVPSFQERLVFHILSRSHGLVLGMAAESRPDDIFSYRQVSGTWVNTGDGEERVLHLSNDFDIYRERWGQMARFTGKIRGKAYQALLLTCQSHSQGESAL